MLAGIDGADMGEHQVLPPRRAASRLAAGSVVVWPFAVGWATMESKTIDSADFRAAQHKQWDSAAIGWKEWSEFTDAAAGHIAERLVELADVQAGSKVLDVAAGYGEPALTAARKAGADGH